MRTISLNVACILILFNIEAPVHGGLEADFKEESFIRYVTVSQPRFSDPLECFVNAGADVRSKTPRPIQVPDNTSL